MQAVVVRHNGLSILHAIAAGLRPNDGWDGNDRYPGS